MHFNELSLELNCYLNAFPCIVTSGINLNNCIDCLLGIGKAEARKRVNKEANQSSAKRKVRHGARTFWIED